MPGIALTSSSAVNRPPVRLEIVPPVARSFTRGASTAGAAGGWVAVAVCAAVTASWTIARSARVASTLTKRLPVGSAALTLFRRLVHLGMEWIQMPVEESPHPVPRIALLARVLRLPRLRIDAAVEGVAAGRVVVDHRLGERRLARAQRVDELHVLFDVHVLVVPRNADVERNLQLVDVVERRAVLVDLV